MSATTDPKQDWVTRVLGYKFTAGRGDRLAEALEVWQSARAKVVQQLTRLAVAIKQGTDPDKNGAVADIAALIKNITPQPATLAAAKELESYLNSEDLIDAAEIHSIYAPPLGVRAPLLAALGQVKHELSA
jgi:hypothetical protein